MDITLNLDNESTSEVQLYAELNNRSCSQQLEHWATIGKISEENPEVPYEFLKEVISAGIDENYIEPEKKQFKPVLVK